MELRYPIVFIIGIIVLIVLYKIIKKNVEYSEGKKAANTKYIKNIPYYKEIMEKYKKLSKAIQTTCLVSIILSLILIARPSSVNKNEDEIYNRDIFLCMDVSASVDELNLNLVKKLKDLVKNLNHERFGITIFNTSSSLLVPLTDDYEFINDSFDKLTKSFELSMQYNNYDFSNFNLSSFRTTSYTMDRNNN